MVIIGVEGPVCAAHLLSNQVPGKTDWNLRRIYQGVKYLDGRFQQNVTECDRLLHFLDFCTHILEQCREEEGVYFVTLNQ